MSRLAVRARGVGKRFQILTNHRTLLRVLRAMVRGEAMYRDVWVLRDVSFEIRQGERVALLGRNGSGKTTLLRMMAGIYDRSEGKLRVHQRPRALFSYAAGLHPDLAVMDNLYLFGAVHGMARRDLAPQAEEILLEAGLGDLRHAPLKVLSTGQVQRLALSVFARSQDGLLIFDEALSNVDQGFLERFDAWFEGLTASGKTLIVTSHDASFLRAHCDTALWLDEGRLRMHGPIDRVLESYEASFAGDRPGAEPVQTASG